MEPFHPLASDADADPGEIAQAQARCALTLGRLDGLLAGLSEPEKALFCWTLLRATLLGALNQAGFVDAELRFDGWFAGTSRAPQESPLTPCPAHALVRSLLAELARHPWQPLAEAALVIGGCGKFAPDALEGDDNDPAEALVEAVTQVTSASVSGQALPFVGLARLAAQLRRSRTFAPIERAAALPLFGKGAPIARAAMRTPLWAVDCQLGYLLAAQIQLTPALPFPGAVPAEALAPQLWPGERALILADAMRRSAERHISAIQHARSDCRALDERLRHLRASARAPQVWLALRGFGPMGIDQLTAGFGLSRRGTYAVTETLVEAGLATRATTLGRAIMSALPPGHVTAGLEEPLRPLPSPLLAEFDAAMADIDRLLSRSSTQSG